MTIRLRRFIILFQGRSGSSWLVDALKSHPMISCRDEMLVALTAQGPEAQLRWTYHFFSGAPQGSQLVAGFKVKLSDIQAPGRFADLLREFDCRVILLERDDSVRQVISWFRADALNEQSGQYNIGRAAPQPPPIRVDIPALLVRLRQLGDGRRALQDYVAKLGRPTHRLTYEMLLQAPEPRLAEVQAFLEVPARPLSWSIGKATPDDLSRAVLNYSELEGALAETPWRLEELHQMRAGAVA